MDEGRLCGISFAEGTLTFYGSKRLELRVSYEDRANLLSSMLNNLKHIPVVVLSEVADDAEIKSLYLCDIQGYKVSASFVGELLFYGTLRLQFEGPTSFSNNIFVLSKDRSLATLLVNIRRELLPEHKLE